MPPDVHAEFDHNVLDMIENSPVGAVPMTPSYQEAINRLRTSQQIYPDADHKNGFVTSRSLSKRPSFHAENLEALIAGTIGPEALEADGSIFDRYVASLPSPLRANAEALRLKVAGRPAHHRKHGGIIVHDPIHSLFLVPGTGLNPGITGNYLYGSILQLGADPENDGWSIHLHDSDDGAANADSPTMSSALEKLQEVIASAPFHMNELASLGFHLK